MDSGDLDEREYPDPSDMDDDDEAGTIDCPYCGKEIAEESEWCAKCGEYLSREDSPRTQITWVIITAVALVGAFVAFLLLFGNRIF